VGSHSWQKRYPTTAHIQATLPNAAYASVAVGRPENEMRARLDDEAPAYDERIPVEAARTQCVRVFKRPADHWGVDFNHHAVARLALEHTYRIF
jgi:hypothetical protein